MPLITAWIWKGQRLVTALDTSLRNSFVHGVSDGQELFLAESHNSIAIDSKSENELPEIVTAWIGSRRFAAGTLGTEPGAVATGYILNVSVSAVSFSRTGLTAEAQRTQS